MISDKRAPRAVVGPHRIEEQMFGRAFDKNIVRRIWAFVRPYRAKMVIPIAAVLIFTSTQLLIPLIIRYAIHHGMTPGSVDRIALLAATGAFLLAILVNYAASYTQETVVSRWRKRLVVAPRVSQDGRRAEHQQGTKLRVAHL